jgi:hypothetical protein
MKTRQRRIVAVNLAVAGMPNHSRFEVAPNNFACLNGLNAPLLEQGVSMHGIRTLRLPLFLRRPMHGERRTRMAQNDRAADDRRSGKDRRRKINLSRFTLKGPKEPDRRSPGERRDGLERRSGWVKIGRWASVQLDRLKISKFLIQK